jgi:hypothetical protein
MGLLNLLAKKKLNDFIGKLKLFDLADPDKREDLVRRLYKVKEIRDMLTGYRTYIIAALYAVISAGEMLGYIPKTLADQLRELLAGGALATVAAKLNRMGRF